MENNLSPQEEIKQLINDRVKNLSMNGEHERASSILIEYNRSLLADSHPSKKPSLSGTIQGEQVSELLQFEEKSQKTKDVMAFISAITLGGKSAETMGTTLASLMDFIVYEHPNLLAEATAYLREKKKEQGLVQTEWAEVKEISEQKHLPDSEN